MQGMTTTLIAVAQSAKARFFRHSSDEKHLQQISVLTHPESALHDGDLLADRHGTTTSSMGPQQRAYSTHESPTEVEADRFAKEVIAMITQSRLSNDFDRAVLIAPPTFLGKLRNDMSAADKKFVTGELAKNLTDHETDDIATHVTELLGAS